MSGWPVALVVPSQLAAGGPHAPAEVLCRSAGFACCVERQPDEVLASVRRRRPDVIVIDARESGSRVGSGYDVAHAVLQTLKDDAITALLPAVVFCSNDTVAAWLDQGADEACDPGAETSYSARLRAAVRRNLRDLNAQPTTLLPGARAIEAELGRRIAAGVPFAACYADLDHFKEFNDRYGFHEGDRIIRMLARILYDAALGVAGAETFVGHIGGDDFMLVVPPEHASAVCGLAIEIFDTLVPLQYSEADRRAGYYFGKDRRGQLHRVPLMTLSIGAATTERRRLRTPAEVSRLASEMKSFAKARPGSVFAVDRRGDEEPPPAATSPTPRSVAP